MPGIRLRSEFRSLNGTPYKLEIWDKNHSTTDVTDFNVTAGSLEVSFDAKGEEKLTPIICSNMKFEFIIENEATKEFIDYLRADDREEKDVYVALLNGTRGAYEPQFTGYILLDLGEVMDESNPRGVELVAVDGLALLKEVDFVPNEQTNVPPYAMNDTYILPANTPSGGRYATFLVWLCEALQKADLGGGTNTINSGWNSYRVATAVNWYNEEHATLSGTLTAHDPLKNTACNGEQFYKQDGQSNSGILYYKPKSTYDAIVHICRAWGMRCIMYAQRVWFIQVSEYRKSETGTIPIPDNIRSFNYNQTGGNALSAEYIGNNGIARYEQELENALSTEGGLQKLATSSWGEYPIIKRVATDFPSISNYNAYTGFPMLYGKDQSPRTWPTFGVDSPGVQTGRWEDTTTSLGTFNDAYLLDGFYMMISLQFMNTFAGPVEFQMAWTIRAKPTGGNWDASDALVATWSENLPSGGWQLHWEPYYPLGDLNTELGGEPGYDGRFINQWNSTLGNTNGNVDDQMFFKNIQLPFGTSTVDIIAGTEVGNNGNLMPPHPDMQGDWDFELIARHHGPSHNYGAWFCDWHGATAKVPPMPPITAPPWANIQTAMDPDYPNPPGTPYYGMWGPAYNVWYNDVAPSLNLCMFSPVSGGAVGSSSYNTQYYTNTNDSYVLNIKETLWGDTDTTDVPGSIKVYTGSAWKFTDYLGRWGTGVTTGMNSFTEMLCSDALNMQSIFSEKGNYTIAWSNTNKDLSGSSLYPKYVNPIGRIFDAYNEHYYVPMKQTNNIHNDEIGGMWFQMIWDETAGTIVVHPNDDGGGPVDDDDVGASGLTNDNTALASISMGGIQSQPRLGSFDPILLINDNKRRSLKATTYAFTSLLVSQQGQTAGQTLKTGDKVILEDKGRVVELTLTADFVLQADATEENPASTSIQFSSTSLLWNVTDKAKIYMDVPDWYNQSMRKTRGTIAGFTVDSDGLTKGGVEITGFLDSDTMTGASANNLPTAESVKAYVDASIPSEADTLQTVTDRGNSTTNQIDVNMSDGTGLNVDSGPTNTIAIFKSSDNKGFIRIEDNDTEAYLVAEGSSFWIGPDSTTKDLRLI